MEASASRSRVFIERNLGSTVCKGSNGPCCSALSTKDRSQEGMGGAWRIQPSCPPKEPDDPVMLFHRLLFHRVVVGSNRGHVDLEGGGRQPSLQPLLQEGQNDSDRASPGVFSVRRAPFDEGLKNPAFISAGGTGTITSFASICRIVSVRFTTRKFIHFFQNK